MEDLQKAGVVGADFEEAVVKMTRARWVGRWLRTAGVGADAGAAGVGADVGWVAGSVDCGD